MDKDKEKMIKEIKELSDHDKYLEKKKFVEKAYQGQYLQAVIKGFNYGKKFETWEEVIDDLYKEYHSWE